MSDATVDYDVMIAGGGMVGTALACALGDSALRVAVLEAGPEPILLPTPGKDYDLRVSAISAASCALFEALGAWKEIKQFRVSDIQEMHIWDAGGSGSIHFDAADTGVRCLGYIIENSVMLTKLHEQMKQQTNISYHPRTKLENIKLEPDSVTVQTDQGQRWRASVLVGADGAHSLVRQLLAIKTRGHAFGQKAIVATVETEKPHRQIAWQRFLPSGPLAFLPLEESHQCSIVWSLDTTRAIELMKLNDAEFINELETAFEKTLGAITHISERQAFELMLAHAQHYVQDRIALVGDAAHRMHPLAGQGVNMGYADVAVLAQVMLDADREHKDIGDYKVLRRYERWRKGDNTAMLAVTDGFKQLFSNDQPLLKLLRNTGMDISDKVQPFKNKIMRLASGMEAELPNIIKDVSFMP